MAGSTKPAQGESKTKGRRGEQDKPSTEEASAKLAAMLDQAEPKDAEQPKPATRGNGKAKATGNGKGKAAEGKAETEKPEKKKLAENELSGDVKDGETVRIGLPRLSGANAGEIVSARLTVPKTFYLAKPEKGRLVHVIDESNPKKTLCTLSTETQQSSWVKLPDDTFVNCEWCARRLVAAKKITQAELDKRKKALEAAREAQVKALAEAAAKAKAEKEAKAKAEADAKAKAEAAEQKKLEAEAKKAERKAAQAAKQTAKPQARPDPKPQPKRSPARRTSRSSGRQAA